jgi:hypothetical protein
MNSCNRVHEVQMRPNTRTHEHPPPWKGALRREQAPSRGQYEYYYSCSVGVAMGKCGGS